MLEPPPPKEEKSRTIDGLDLHQAPLPPIASKTEEPEETPPSPQYNKLFDTESTHAETPEITIHVPQTPNYGRMQEQNPPVPSSSSVPPSANYSRMQSPPEGTSTIPPSATYSRMQSPPEESSTVPPSAVYSRMQSPPEESSTVPPSAVYSRMQSPPEATSSVPQSAVYSRMMSNEEEATDADGKKDEKGAAFFMTQVFLLDLYWTQLYWECFVYCSTCVFSTV